MLGLARRILGGGQGRFYVWASLAALGLRLLWIGFFPGVVDDSRLYANVAENWVQHHVYGVTDSGVVVPTLSRLPGYPAFLAAVFAVFGTENFRAVLLVQTLIDLATCFLIASIAWRFGGNRAARAAFLLAGLCPFLGNYAAAALTETLEIFFTTLALELAFRGLGVGENQAPSSPTGTWLGCGLSVGGAILLRPDGGILLAAIGAYLLWLMLRGLRGRGAAIGGRPLSARAILLAGLLVAIGAVAPLVPWTLRNWHTLHRFQPLAPRYANDSDELVVTGFNRWVKTWMAEYVSVQEIYWNVPGTEIDATNLPRRAFDSDEQADQTRALFGEYNQTHDISPELDARFAALAAQRVHHSLFRYYVWLPALRIADMWLRPRIELLASDPRWWEFNDDPRWLAVSLAFGAINLAYVLMAAVGLVRGRELFGIGLFVSFLLLRSAFLGTLENPEPRYTLECFPAVIVLASLLFRSPA